MPGQPFEWQPESSVSWDCGEIDWVRPLEILQNCQIGRATSVSVCIPVLIAHQFDTPGRVLVSSRNRGSPVRGCETTISCDICRSQRTRLTVQKIQLVESRGAVCRPHQFLLMEGYFAQSKTLHYSHRVNLMFLITENLDVVAICTNPQV